MNRAVAPDFKQAKKLDVVFPEKIVSENGVEIYWLKEVKDNSVKLDIEWNAGTKYQSKKLVAGFTNKMLLSGSNQKTALQIAEEIDFYGGYTNLEVDKDHSSVTLYGLNDTIESIFDLFAEAFLKADFPEKELKKEIEISKSNFNIDIEKVKVLCRRTFNQNLYGSNSKYGQVAEISDFDNLKREDLIQYYKEFYSTKPVVFITGRVDEKLFEKLKKWLTNFNVEPQTDFKQNIAQTKGRIKVEKADAIQSAVRIGRLMFDKNHPDYFSFQLLNTILGGYFGSRLMANIREEKGYTYGIGSGLAVLQDAGYFFVSTEVGKEVREDTLNEVFKEFDRLKTELIGEDELQKVKNYTLGEFLRHADGPNSQMEIFKNIYFNQLPTNYYQEYINAIHSTTSADLKKLANKYLLEEEMLIVTAG